MGELSGWGWRAFAARPKPYGHPRCPQRVRLCEAGYSLRHRWQLHKLSAERLPPDVCEPMESEHPKTGWKRLAADSELSGHQYDPFRERAERESGHLFP